MLLTLPGLADVVWTALYFEERLLSVWVILAGLIVEYFFVWKLTDLGAGRSIVADITMNAASTLLGIFLIPYFGFVVEIVPGEIFGPFHFTAWIAAGLMAALLNAVIECLVLWKVFKQNIRPREFWWFLLANVLSVGIAFATFLYRPFQYHG